MQGKGAFGDLGASPAIGPDGTPYFGLYAETSDGGAASGHMSSAPKSSGERAIGADMCLVPGRCMPSAREPLVGAGAHARAARVGGA